MTPYMAAGNDRESSLQQLLDLIFKEIDVAGFVVGTFLHLGRNLSFTIDEKNERGVEAGLLDIVHPD